MAFPPNPDQPTQYGEKAKQEAQGWYDAGLFDALEGVVNNGLTKAANSVVTFLFGGLDVIIVLVAQAVFAVLGELDPAFGTIASVVVGNMFEVPVNTDAFTNLYDSSGRKAIAHAVGNNLLKAFKGDQANVGAGELQPSTQAAEDYLGVMANLAIEGWTFEVLGGLVPFVHLDKLGELKDAMTRVLGLGRMSRAVLRPFVNTLIATPALWAVNKQYRPKMLGVSDAAAAVLRGDLDEATFLEIAQRDGYGDDAIATIMRATRKNVSPADAYLLFQLGLKDQAWTIAQLRAGGLDADEAETVFHLQEAKSLRAYQLEAAQSAVTAYGDRRIDDRSLADELDHLGLDQTTLDRFHAEASRRRRLSVLHLTRADVEQAVVLEVLSTSDYADWLHARGYGENDALTLELMLQAKLNKLNDARSARAAAAAERAAQKAAKAQAARARRDAIAGEHAHWTGTLGEAERLVVRQVMPTNQYRQILIDHNLSAGDADALVTVAVQDRDARTAAGAKRAAAAAKNPTPALSLSTLERATIMGALSVDQLRAELTTRNYDVVDAGIIVDLVNDAIAARQAALARTAAAAATLASKSINLAQVQKAVVDGVQSLAQYAAFLTAQKFDATSIATLVADMQVQLNNRALANERHAAAVAKLEASHLSLAEEEKAVVKGILTLADYQGYLVAHDFDAADVAILTALLETKLPSSTGGA